MNKLKNNQLKENTYKKLLNNFFRGLLLAVPIAVTVYIIFNVFSFVDKFLYNENVVGKWYYGKDHFPGLGFVIVILIILFLGFLSNNYMTKNFVSLIDNLLEKTPVIKLLYGSSKDIIEGFVGDKKKFNHPVLVELTQEGIYKIGFITNKDLSFLSLEGFSAVYFPKSYGIMGDLYFVNNNKIKPIKGESKDIFKMIISGGLTGVSNESD